MEDALFCEVQFFKQSKKQKFIGKENTICKNLKTQSEYSPQEREYISE